MSVKYKTLGTFLTILFSFLINLLFGQNPRVPNLNDGNYLLYKNDSVIVSYYWHEVEKKLEMPGNFEYYEYYLTLKFTNLTKDTIHIMFNISTFELKPANFSSKGFSSDQKTKFFPIEPFSNTGFILQSNSFDIVDFEIKDLIIKYSSGKKVNVTSIANRSKHIDKKKHEYKKLIKITEE